MQNSQDDYAKRVGNEINRLDEDKSDIGATSSLTGSWDDTRASSPRKPQLCVRDVEACRFDFYDGFTDGFTV